MMQLLLPGLIVGLSGKNQKYAILQLRQCSREPVCAGQTVHADEVPGTGEFAFSHWTLRTRITNYLILLKGRLCL